MTGLYLGEITFESFELPGRIDFGGAQRLAVHKLIGGGRVIDTLGRDDLALSWTGVLSGQDAAERARTLDLMRVEGSEHSLSWDAFCYSVVISKLKFQYRSPWWIPYEISCVVQADLAQGSTLIAISSAQALASDLSTAAGFLGPAFTQAISSVSALAPTGVAGQSQARATLASIQSQASTLLLSDQVLIQSDDLATVVTAAGSMANLSCGSGYIGRSAANLGSMGF